MQQLKATMRDDPTEKAVKHGNRSHYDLNERVAQKAHELMQKQRLELIAKHGPGYLDAPVTDEMLMDEDPIPLWDPVPSIASLENRLRK